MSCLALALLLAGTVKPAFATVSVANDPDDPAIWVNERQPDQSRILGTDKIAVVGSLYVFNLEGNIVQRIEGLDRPNNVDVLGNYAVVTERKQRRLRIFSINPSTGALSDVTGRTAVFAGEAGEDGEPMGIALYQRPRDRALFAIVTPKAGPLTNHLAQYRLEVNPTTQKVDARLVRRFGAYSGKKETESVAVDQDLGYVYYSDETVGNRKYHADPDAPGAGRELNLFNNTDTVGDHEGIGIWETRRGKGFVVCTDQVPGDSVFRVYRREGNNEPVGSFTGRADETDGIDICARNLGPWYPKGIMVAMNSGARNFLVYDLREVAKALR